MTRQEREPMSSSKMSVTMLEDPFVILGATPKSEYSSFGLFQIIWITPACLRSQRTQILMPQLIQVGGFRVLICLLGFQKPCRPIHLHLKNRVIQLEGDLLTS
jgi:hypothetical protein